MCQQKHQEFLIKSIVKCIEKQKCLKIIFNILYADCILCFLRILQVPAAYAPIDPDSPPALSTHFMKKCNLQYILVEKQQINVSVYFLNVFYVLHLYFN